ncbi:unnamed protein product [Meloidogyne enterolobii]|uniref:Uncharacterized protein n=1 Tax=Meloidogyne enterolobii TaxID=390850 RepID=A0ACB0Z6S6_MELEN
MFTAPSLTLKMLQKRLKNGELDLSSLRLETVPIELICRCVNFGGEKHKKIKEINLSNNLLTELPQQFCAFFSELEVLNLGNNKIKALPEDFGSLSSLYHLDLSNNRIKKLPASFGDLDILKWLNLANNPLDGDLAEIIGECLDDYQCATAAVNAVQYVGFSYAHSAESTAIIDDSSDIAPTNESSSNNSSPDFKEIEHVHKRKKFRKMTTLSKSESKSIEKRKIEEDEDGFDSYFYGKFVMFFFFAFLIALGTSLWLTFDSMRENYLNEDLSKNVENIQNLEELQQFRFCLEINKMLKNGEPPNSWKQFLQDFYFTFKNAWGRNVADKIEEKIKSLNICCWTNSLIKWIKIVWQLLFQPIFVFFTDYFIYVWDFFILPMIKSFGF